MQFPHKYKLKACKGIPKSGSGRPEKLVKNLTVEGQVIQIKTPQGRRWNNWIDVIVKFKKKYIWYSTAYNHTREIDRYRLRLRREEVKRHGLCMNLDVMLTFNGNGMYWDLFELSKYHIPQETLSQFKQRYPVNSLVTGKVLNCLPKGLLLKIDGISAWMPNSEIDINSYRKPEDYVGQQMEVRILSIDFDIGQILVSRKQKKSPPVPSKKDETLSVDRLLDEIKKLQAEISKLKSQTDKSEGILSSVRKENPDW